MDSLRIETGRKAICINDDPSRVIEFNPADVTFAERFYALVQNFEAKQIEFEQRQHELEANPDIQENGLPANLGERIAFVREICNYLRQQIDILFGNGTSQIVFGDAMNLEMFEQFLVGITPYIQQARGEKLVKYAPKKNAGRVMR